MHRSTRIRYECCQPVHDPVGEITAVKETTPCEYEITVCTLAACSAAAHQAQLDADTSTVSQDLEAARAAVRGVQSDCFEVQRDWWTYEICFGRRVRQYHAEMAPAPRDASTPASAPHVVKKVVQEYMLGFARGHGNLQATTGRQRDELVADQHDRRKSSYVQYFWDGTVCDAAGTHRTAEVRYMCQDQRTTTVETDSSETADDLVSANFGPFYESEAVAAEPTGQCFATGLPFPELMRAGPPRGMDMGGTRKVVLQVANVEEVRTCHYNVEVYLSSLCDLEAFQDRATRRSALACRPRTLPDQEGQ